MLCPLTKCRILHLSKMMYQTTLAVVLGLTGVASAGYTNSTQVNLPGASGPVAYGTPKVETHYTSQSVDTFVATSVINIFAPLDASFPSHSAECDYLVRCVFCILHILAIAKRDF